MPPTLEPCACAGAFGILLTQAAPFFNLRFTIGVFLEHVRATLGICGLLGSPRLYISKPIGSLFLSLFLDFRTQGHHLESPWLHFFVLDVIVDRPRPQGHQPEHTKGTQVTTPGPQPRFFSPLGIWILGLDLGFRMGN